MGTQTKIAESLIVIKMIQLTGINHLAITVSDVGRSLDFYTDVLGMKQILRPDFDRHGGRLTFGNLDLHLIKGRPCVHEDDDLIVGHMALVVTDMAALKEHLKKKGVQYRTNVSVPSPDDQQTGIVNQAFVRDPDGYDIEFCNCSDLDDFLHRKKLENAEKYNLSVLNSVLKYGRKLRQVSQEAKTTLLKRNWKVKFPELENVNLETKPLADPVKLANLHQRHQNVYGDLIQNVSMDDIEKLLRIFNNHVPSVIGALLDKVMKKGTRTHIPPAFYERNGDFYQPPSFEIPVHRSYQFAVGG